MIKTSMQLKAKVRNLSGGDSDTARALIRIFFMERFLERLSVSSYRDSFILKGGMLTASLIGVNLRATVDIDTTVVALPVEQDEMIKIVKEVCDVQLDDVVTFELVRAETIMDEFDYPGIRIYMTGFMDKLRQPFKIDISTDDAITPGAIEYGYRLMFEERNIQLNSYNIETVLAEKSQTVIIRGLANTRMRDFYDIYEITLRQKYSGEIFNEAFQATCKKRSTIFDENSIHSEIENIRSSSELKNSWEQFYLKNHYVEKIG